MRVDVSLSGIHFNDEKETIGRVHESYGNLAADFPAYSGWVDLPAEFDDALFKDIEDTAEKLREKCELLIVIGIGGSFLGAKAVTEALGGSRDGFPEILFAGFNMSASYLKKVETRMMGKDVCLCVISKSGTTTEPLLTYHILKKKLTERYGESAASERIYVITGREGSVLRDEAEINGNKTFDVPDDIGGRYSVLSPVGTVPYRLSRA